MQEFLLVAGVHLLAVMSPGPDFAMVLRNSLVHSRRTGIFAAAGLGLGIMVHVIYSMLGIALVISQSILLFNIIKWLGAVYLVYIGIKSLLAKAPAKSELIDEEASDKQTDLPVWQAVRMGFLTNVLNPKATLFFLALFTQVINPGTNMAIKFLYGIEMSLATFAWFALVATLLTQKPIQKLFAGVRGYLDKAFGAILIALGLKIAFSGNK